MLGMRLIRDITYCWYDHCPLTNCERHLAQINYVRGISKIYSAADFHQNCVAYNTYVEFGEEAGIAAAERGETGEWMPEGMKWREQ